MICTKILPSVTLKMTSEEIGSDIFVTLTGGDAHIGAVALASFDAATGEITDGVQVVPGHKEGDIALNGARNLAKELSKTVVLAVGIHVDDLSDGDLDDIIRGCGDLVGIFGRNYA